MRPRVLHVARVDFLGGVERVTLTLAAARGAAGAIVGPGGGELERSARSLGVPFFAAPVERTRITGHVGTLLRYPTRWRAAGAAIARACEAFRPDLLHAHHPATVLQARPAARAFRLPVLFHVHEIGPAKPLYRVALAAAARSATRIVCVSGAGLDLVRGVRPPKRTAARVLHNGVDPSFEREAVEVAAADLRPGGPHVGAFGVLEPRKGQHVLLEAAPEVLRRWPEARLWLVGPLALSDKADYAASLERRAAQPGLAGAVRFTGFRADVAALMKAMDVVVLPSVAHESLSMVLLESLTLGRRVVATRVGGATEAVRDGETGILVPPGDASALAAAIARMLGDEGSTMAERARLDARARFSSAAFLGRVDDLYAELVAGRPRS